MDLRLRRIWVVFAVAAVLSGFVQAETYHLGNDNSWKNAADTPDGEYLLAVSKIKRQLVAGTQADVVEALETLKSDFPEIAGAEIDSYLEAEKLYADIKWYKAATVYKRFLDAWPESVLRPAAMERVYSIINIK